MVFAGFSMLAYTDKIQTNQQLTNTLRCLGYALITQAAMTTLIGYFMSKKSLWMLVFIGSVVSFIMTATTSILISEIYSGNYGQSSPGVTSVDIAFTNSPMARDCITKLLSHPHETPDSLCQSSLLATSLSPAKHLLIWSINGLFFSIFSLVMLFRQARDTRLHVSSFSKIGVTDICMTLLFVVAFISGYAYYTNVEKSASQHVVFSSSLLGPLAPKIAKPVQTSHVQSNVKVSATTGWFVTSANGMSQQSVNNTSVFSEVLSNGTIHEKRIVVQKRNDTTHGYMEVVTTEDKFSFPNKSVVTYYTITNNTKSLAGDSNSVTSKKVMVSNSDGTTNTYALEGGSRRRRILAEVELKPSALGHNQASVGANYLLISCFTGFGTASLINVNMITDTVPSMDACRTRLSAERPNYTVERLRDRVNQYRSQNPSSAQ